MHKRRSQVPILHHQLTGRPHCSPLATTCRPQTQQKSSVTISSLWAELASACGRVCVWRQLDHLESLAQSSVDAKWRISTLSGESPSSICMQLSQLENAVTQRGLNTLGAPADSPLQLEAGSFRRFSALFGATLRLRQVKIMDDSDWGCKGVARKEERKEGL